MAGQWKAFTMVPGFGRVPISATGLSIVDFRKQCRQLITRYLPSVQAVGYIDVSWNRMSAIGEEDHWQFHAHGGLRGSNKKSEEQLRKALKRHPGAGHKPLLLQPMHSPAGQIAYMAKPLFVRRVSYLDAKGQHNTRLEPLSVDQELVLAELMGSLKASQRSFSVRHAKSVKLKM